MATYRKRGKYSYQVYYKDKENNNKQVIVGTYDTEAEAKKVSAELTLEMSVGKRVERKQGIIKVSDALDEYEKLEAAKKKGYANSTKYLLAMFRDKDSNGYLDFINLNLGALKASHLNTWMNKRLTKVTAATCVRNINELSAFFNWCKRHYSLEWFNNPVQAIKKPSVQNDRDRVLNEATEESKLFEKLKESRTDVLYYAALFCIETGVRRGEACSIQWNQIYDLDTEEPYMVLDAGQTKTNSKRAVPLSIRAVEALKGLQEVQAKLKEKEERLGHRRTTDRRTPKYEYILSGIKPGGLSQAFKKARDKAGVHDFRLHDCRHTFVTRMLEDGFNLTEVMSASGHKTLSSAKRYINHQAQSLARKMRDKNKS